MNPVLIGAAVVATGVAFALSGDDKKSDDTNAKKFSESDLPPDAKLNSTQSGDGQIPAWAKRNS